jgi:hypothetical protein
MLLCYWRNLVKLTAGTLLLVICQPFQKLNWGSNSLWGAAIANLGWLNIGQLPAGVPQANHKRLYSLQTLCQLDINTDQKAATLN